MADFITMELAVRNKEIRIKQRDNLATCQVGNKIKFNFETSEWNDSAYTKTLIFKVDSAITAGSISSDNIAVIPAAVCKSENLGKIVYLGLRLTEILDEYTYNTTGQTADNKLCYKKDDKWYSDEGLTVEITAPASPEKLERYMYLVDSTKTYCYKHNGQYYSSYKYQSTEVVSPTNPIESKRYSIYYPTIYCRLGVLELGADADSTVISSNPEITSFDAAITYAQQQGAIAKQWAVGSTGSSSDPSDDNCAYGYSNLSKKWAIGSRTSPGTPTDDDSSYGYALLSNAWAQEGIGATSAKLQSGEYSAKTWAEGELSTHTSDSKSAKEWSSKSEAWAEEAADATNPQLQTNQYSAKTWANSNLNKDDYKSAKIWAQYAKSYADAENAPITSITQGAKQYADIAQKWAGSTDESPTDTNNAYYYSTQSKAWAGSTDISPTTTNNAYYYSTQSEAYKNVAKAWAEEKLTDTRTLPTNSYSAQVWAEGVLSAEGSGDNKSAREWSAVAEDWATEHAPTINADHKWVIYDKTSGGTIVKDPVFGTLEETVAVSTLAPDQSATASITYESSDVSKAKLNLNIPSGRACQLNKVEYGISSSSSEEPTSWSESFPELEKGKFIWTKYTWIYYTDSGVATTRIQTINNYCGKDGADGTGSGDMLKATYDIPYGTETQIAGRTDGIQGYIRSICYVKTDTYSKNETQTEINNAITTALGSYYTKTETQTYVSNYVSDYAATTALSADEVATAWAGASA